MFSSLEQLPPLFCCSLAPPITTSSSTSSFSSFSPPSAARSSIRSSGRLAEMTAGRSSGARDQFTSRPLWAISVRTTSTWPSVTATSAASSRTSRSSCRHRNLSVLASTIFTTPTSPLAMAACSGALLRLSGTRRPLTWPSRSSTCTAGVRPRAAARWSGVPRYTGSNSMRGEGGCAGEAGTPCGQQSGIDVNR